jgi:xanthine dehydrogenase YagR molybdenum-binding subunit
MGVASSLYPVYFMPNAARAHADADGRYRIEIAAADIGQGAWTVLRRIAAEALEVPLDAVTIAIGATDFPRASVAGGSSGTTSWGTAITQACRKLRATLADAHGGVVPAAGVSVEIQTEKNPATDRFAMYAFGAQFAEARIDVDTGEVRVPRMCGMFAAGRIIEPILARSQFIGGMTMGLSMALHEHSVIDAQFGHYANGDFAEYHIAVNADVPAIEVGWIDEHDPHVNPMGSKGIGEIGIVGTAAAIANAAYNATGIRVRRLPLTLDAFLAGS